MSLTIYVLCMLIIYPFYCLRTIPRSVLEHQYCFTLMFSTYRDATIMLLLFFHRQVIWQSNHSNVPVQQVIEIPPEFDPDSSEFVSDISDYATEFKKEEILHIPFEFDLDRADLAPDIEHHSIELQREQMEIPLDFDPDSAELSPDITEYTTKLKQV